MINYYKLNLTPRFVALSERFDGRYTFERLTCVLYHLFCEIEDPEYLGYDPVKNLISYNGYMKYSTVMALDNLGILVEWYNPSVEIRNEIVNFLFEKFKHCKEDRNFDNLSNDIFNSIRVMMRGKNDQ